MDFFVHLLCIDRSNFKGMILPYYVYVFQSQRDLLIYHGFTTNLEQRIRNHNAGKTRSTSKSQLSKIA
ncbi:GIY-YIG nuclease family protein [Eudoraea sp.]|uniref:GIY-YIG nuclease family protein n=1 Tax=Eudoraea sp. TaxID=1979955 RepID=UPI003C73B744